MSIKWSSWQYQKAHQTNIGIQHQDQDPKYRKELVNVGLLIVIGICAIFAILVNIWANGLDLSRMKYSLLLFYIFVDIIHGIIFLFFIPIIILVDNNEIRKRLAAYFRKYL